jgi:ATP-dependent RNA helicase RhlE
MDGFKRGKYQVMVATDIAARGIDVTGISHVINYDVPAYAEDYIHRIGRTGRAEATGDAIMFVSREEDKYLRKIEKFIGRDLKPERCKDFKYVRPKQPKSKLVDKPAPVLHSGKFPTAGRKARSSQRRRRKTTRR